jgi:hypothetical protein
MCSETTHVLEDKKPVNGKSTGLVLDGEVQQRTYRSVYIMNTYDSANDVQCIDIYKDGKGFIFEFCGVRGLG